MVRAMSYVWWAISFIDWTISFVGYAVNALFFIILSQNRN